MLESISTIISRIKYEYVEVERFIPISLNLRVFPLQSGWSIPVELVIGSDVGIAYTTDSAITVSRYYNKVIISLTSFLKRVIYYQICTPSTYLIK